MAQLSRLAQLYYKISVNLTEDEVRDLRSLLAVDKILGKAKTEKATPLEIFNMLADDKTIGRGNLGFLVQVLRCLGKGELAEEAERLEQEHKIKEKKTTVVTPDANGSEDEQVTTESRVGAAALTTSDSTSEDTESEETEVKEIISTEHSPGEIATDHQRTTETCDDTDVRGRGETSELASLHIRELERLIEEPMKTLGPIEPDTSADIQDAKSRLVTLLAELDTPAVVADQEKQSVLYCQIGDLYRAKLYNLELALQYYRSMLECSLSEEQTQTKAHNRLGLTYDVLGKHEEATRNHERVLEICRDVNADEVDICVARKNLATSLTLSVKHSEAKTNYKTALRLARKTGNKIEEIDINCKLGDLHREQLKEPQVSHMYYTNMLALAKDFESKFWEMRSYNRLGLACEYMQNCEQALEWHQKSLALTLDSANTRDQIITRMNVGALLGEANESKSHLDKALQMAQEKGEEYGQMSVYIHMGDMQRQKFNSLRTSIQYYEKALTLARQLGDRRHEGWAYNRLGDAHVDMKEYGAALEWYQKHLKISQETGHKKDEVTILADVGNAYRLLGNTEQATIHFTTALQLAQQTENLHGQMQVYFMMGDMQRVQLNSPHTAMQYYEQHLALARQLGDRRHEGWAYNRLGWAHVDMREYEVALEWYQKHLKISQEIEDKKDEVTAHTAVGNAYRLLGNTEQATSHFNTALQLAQQTENRHGQMDVYCKMGDLQRKQLHSPRTAIQHYEQYLALARQLGDRREEGWAYNRLGDAHVDMRQYEAALEWYQKHLKISQEIEDKKDEVTVLANVGNAYRLLGNTEQATSHFNTALQLAQQTENRHGQMRVYCKMGDLQQEQLHSPRTAIQYYEQYLALARQLGNRHEEGWAYNRLGDARVAMEEYEAALEWYQKHLKISGEIEDKEDEVTVLTDVGNAYRLLGKTEQATSHFDTALQLAQQTENLHGQMNVYCKMGDMQKKQLHSPRTAIQYYEQHLALARQLGDRHEEGWAYNRLGDAHVNMREYEPALEWYQKHLTISQEIGNKKDEVTVLADVGDAYRLLGKTEQATSHFDTALQLAQQTENLHGQMDVYCKMGDLQREQLHSPRTAIQYYEQYLALARQLGDRRQEGLAYNGLGRAHYAMGEYGNALEWDMKDLAIRQEIGYNLLITHQNIADSYKALGKLDQARSHYQSAMNIAVETGNKQKQMDIYLRLGDLHREQLHEPQESHKYYTEMLALAKDLERKDRERQAYNRLGLACEAMQDNEAALEWHQKHLKMTQEDGNKTEELTAHENIAASYQALGKLEQARSHYQSALTIAMETGNKQQQEDITKALSKLDQVSSHSQSAMAIATETGNEQEQEDITEAMGKLDQVRCQSRSVMAIARKRTGTESGNEQEQRKNSKKQKGHKNCHVS
ncbi:PREDICTED: tetratricopeptide repeat protein 28-like [Branchiostoma belcheri]|uniref:Tetratricopeptide repeat protein 28-like n=1 Tax=Branchiostoma belcheri TaxID=7741 RepID=A0A6P4XTM2_BRABE|nr:PREDICTED: tetratricopeptide repeat protein 28-like [Branchiostoma belcheri]